MLSALSNHYPMLLSWTFLMTTLITVGLAGSTLKRPSWGHLLLAASVFGVITVSIITVGCVLFVSIKLMMLFSASPDVQFTGAILIAVCVLLSLAAFDMKRTKPSYSGLRNRKQ